MEVISSANSNASSASSQAGTPTEESEFLITGSQSNAPKDGQLGVMELATPVKSTEPTKAELQIADSTANQELARERARCKHLEEQLALAVEQLEHDLRNRRGCMKKLNSYRLAAEKHSQKTPLLDAVETIFETKSEDEEEKDGAPDQSNDKRTQLMTQLKHIQAKRQSKGHATMASQTDKELHWRQIELEVMFEDGSHKGDAVAKAFTTWNSSCGKEQLAKDRIDYERIKHTLTPEERALVDAQFAKQQKEVDAGREKREFDLRAYYDRTKHLMTAAERSQMEAELDSKTDTGEKTQPEQEIPEMVLPEEEEFKPIEISLGGGKKVTLEHFTVLRDKVDNYLEKTVSSLHAKVNTPVSPRQQKACKQLASLGSLRKIVDGFYQNREIPEVGQKVVDGVMDNMETWQKTMEEFRKALEGQTLQAELDAVDAAEKLETDEDGETRTQLLVELQKKQSAWKTKMVFVTAKAQALRKQFYDDPARLIANKIAALRIPLEAWKRKNQAEEAERLRKQQAENALDNERVEALKQFFVDEDGPAGLECIRGPNWNYGSQDGKVGATMAKGVVTAYHEGSWSEVEWLESGNTNAYRTGHEGKWDIRIIERPAGWKEPELKNGDRVCISSDWAWGAQNTTWNTKSCSGYGTITYFRKNSWSTVRWDHGGGGRYRTGVRDPAIPTDASGSSYRCWDVQKAPEDAPAEPVQDKSLKEWIEQYNPEWMKYYDNMMELGFEDKLKCKVIQAQLSNSNILLLLGKMKNLSFKDGNDVNKNLKVYRQLLYAWQHPSHNFYNSNPSGASSGLSSGVGFGSGAKSSTFSIEAWQAAHLKTHQDRSSQIEHIHRLLLSDPKGLPAVLDSGMLEYVDEVLCMNSILGAGKIAVPWRRVCSLARFLGRQPLVRQRIDFNRWIKSLKSLQKDVETVVAFAGDGCEMKPGYNCKGEHGFKRFLTPRATFHCDYCSVKMPKGALLYGCRLCNWDVCPKCKTEGEKAEVNSEQNFATGAARVVEETLLALEGRPGRTHSKCELCDASGNYYGNGCKRCYESGKLALPALERVEPLKVGDEAIKEWDCKGHKLTSKTEADAVKEAVDVLFPLIHEGLQVKVGSKSARVSGPAKDGTVLLKFPSWNQPLPEAVENVDIHLPFWNVKSEQDEEKEQSEVEQDPRKRWSEAMTPHLFGTLKEFAKPSFLYANEVNKPLTKLIRRRLAKEFASISKTLTCDPDATIWLRVLDGKQNMTRIRFLVSGPPATPYSRGLWLFDMWVTDRYPLEPPKCKNRTTGNNTVRFNPNLYADGYVCLSVLNTWQGAKEEMWGPHQTLVAICISIQSAILGSEHPYFNEPGYEKQFGTKSAMTTSNNYNKVRRVETIRWAMTDHINNPTPGFEEAIKYHFLHNKDKILKQAEEWREKDAFADQVKTDLEAAYKFLETPEWPKKPETKESEGDKVSDT